MSSKRKKTKTMITNSDIIEIQRILDDRYVRQNICNDRQETVNKKLSNDDKRIEKQETFSAGLRKALWIVAAALASEVVINIFNLIKG